MTGIHHDRLDRALREADALVALLAETAPIMLWTAGLDGLRTFFSSAWLAFTGRTVDQERGTGWSESLHPADWDRCIGAYQAALEEHREFTLRYRLRRHDGAYRLIQETVVPVRGSETTATGYIGCCIDISERRWAQEAWDKERNELGANERTEDLSSVIDALKSQVAERAHAEDTLRESEFKFRQLATNIREVFWMAEPGRAVLYVSPAYEEIWGRSRDELYQNPSSWVEAIHPDDRTQAKLALERQIQGELTDVEYRIVRPDGSTRWIWDRGFPVVESPDERCLFTGIAEDITERKRREFALRLTQVSVDHAADAVFWVDPDAAFSYVNDAACASTGYSRDELLSMTVHDIDPLFPKAVWPEHWQRLKEGRHTVLETRCRRADGTEFPAEVVASYVELEDKECCCCFMRDITVRKAAEEERQAVLAKAHRARQFESLAILSGGIAHDFNNLLTAVLGHAELARMQLPATSSINNDIDQIAQAAQRGAELTRQMLAYSGHVVIEFRPLHLYALVRDAVPSIEAATAGSSVTFKYQITRDLPAVEGDASQLQYALMNVVTNAVEAADGDDAIITIRTGVMQADREYLAETHIGEDMSDGEFSYVEVSDTGCGMDEETKQRMFDPFFTTKFVGRGLGLAAVAGIVRTHHGCIRVESQPGSGTTVRILIPSCHAAR